MVKLPKFPPPQPKVIWVRGFFKNTAKGLKPVQGHFAKIGFPKFLFPTPRKKIK